MPRGLPTALVVLAALAGGCGLNESQYMVPERLEQGLVIILPGIEGESPLNHNIRRGLVDAGVARAMPIYAWGRPIPIAGPLINQMDFIGNRAAGRNIAQMIVDYQDSHPGRSVYIIGHSGGGGVAVFAAEALPEGRSVDGLVLLSASISHSYDLTKALGHCRRGIVNFHNPSDAAMLAIGTTLAGNVDGTRGPSAGLNGFDSSPAGLYQMEMRGDMVKGSLDPHASTTRPTFVARYVAPWILSASWPPAGANGVR